MQPSNKKLLSQRGTVTAPGQLSWGDWSNAHDTIPPDKEGREALIRRLLATGATTGDIARLYKGKHGFSLRTIKEVSRSTVSSIQKESGAIAPLTIGF
jgi:hypothetical protein